MIRPLMINFTDNEGGAAKAALRLYKALRQKGVPAIMHVSRKRTSVEGISGPQNVWDLFKSVAGPTVERLIFQHRIRNRKGLFSVNGLPDSLIRARRRLADHNLIHLHWINGGFIRIETLSRLKEPVVWTLHDIWPFSGGCHYPGMCTRYMEQCGRCPVLESRSWDDLSFRVWKRKSEAWKRLNLVLVAPSRWIGDEAGKSSLFRNRRIAVIPNGVDTDRFRPGEKVRLRRKLNLDTRKKLILATAAEDDSDDRKGINILSRALGKLKGLANGGTIELIVVGAGRPDISQGLEIKTTYAGRIHGEVMMAEYYAAVDLFVAPSREDNLPNTVLEAMACGTPCVAFGVGGLPDMIVHKENGYLAVPYEPDDLAEGIAWALADDKRRGLISMRAREKIVRNFGLEASADRYISLYEELLAAVE